MLCKRAFSELAAAASPKAIAEGILDEGYAGAARCMTPKTPKRVFEGAGVPRLLSANVGLPRDVTWKDKTIQSAVWKFWYYSCSRYTTSASISGLERACAVGPMSEEGRVPLDSSSI